MTTLKDSTRRLNQSLATWSLIARPLNGQTASDPWFSGETVKAILTICQLESKQKMTSRTHTVRLANSESQEY